MSIIPKNNENKGLTKGNSHAIIPKHSRVRPEYRGVEQLEARRAHNPEVVGSSPASATIKNTGFRKKSGVFLTFQPKMEVPKPSIGVSLGLCATCTKEKTELF